MVVRRHMEGVVTFFYGCKCHRREARETKFSERMWLLFLCCSFLLTFLNMYLWLVSRNEEERFNWGFWDSFGIQFKWFFTFEAASIALCGYTFLLLFLALLHTILKRSLQLCLLHKVLVVFADVVTLAVLLLSVWKTRFIWHFITLSFLFLGPFLHLAAVVIVTLMSWFVAGGMHTMEKNRSKRKGSDATHSQELEQFLTSEEKPQNTKCVPSRDLIVWYFLLLAALYACPLFIKPPCILPMDVEPSKPKLFGHKGAEQLAPENTLISFQTAIDRCNVHGIETDVRISLDGIPFCMHDKNLRRTTNIKSVYPRKAFQALENLTSNELGALEAGSWFLRKDPFGTAAHLTDSQQKEYLEQKIPTMTQVLSLALDHKISVLFDLLPPFRGHPYCDTFVNHTLQFVRNLGITDNDMDVWKAPNGDHYVVHIKKFDNRILNNVYNDVDFHTIRKNAEKGISTNVWTVNYKWVFSLFWCGSTYSVTTSACQDLRDVAEPSWRLSYAHYVTLWVTFDLVSFIWVVIFFVCRLRRKDNAEGENSYNIEMSNLA